MHHKVAQARALVSQLRAARDATNNLCPLDFLIRQDCQQHDVPFACVGPMFCRSCASTTHFQCTIRPNLPTGTCNRCYLPQTLCQERLHDSEKEFGTDLCPWWPLTLTVLQLWRLQTLAPYGITPIMTPKDVIEALWRIPEQGDLFPLAAKILKEYLDKVTGAMMRDD